MPASEGGLRAEGLRAAAEALNDKAWVVQTDYGYGKPNMVPLEDVAEAAVSAYLAAAGGRDVPESREEDG